MTTENDHLNQIPRLWETPVFDTQALQQYLFGVVVRQSCTSILSDMAHLTQRAFELKWIEPGQDLPRTEEFMSDLWTRILTDMAEQLATVPLKLCSGTLPLSSIHVEYVDRNPPHDTNTSYYGLMRDLDAFYDSCVPDVLALRMILHTPYGDTNNRFRALLSTFFASEAEPARIVDQSAYQALLPKERAPFLDAFDLTHVLFLPYVTPAGRQNLASIYSELMGLYRTWWDAQSKYEISESREGATTP